MNSIDHIDPRIGTDNPGNCLIGPYRPLGLARVGPDTVKPQPTGGYCSRDPIVHFSHTHVSGTGGGSRYGNIAVVPFTGHLTTRLGVWDKSDEEVHCGRYAVTLQPSGVRCEMTCSDRCGVHRFVFPKGSEANILLDAGACIQIDSNQHWWLGHVIQTCTGGFMERVSDHEVIGRGDFRGGWAPPFPHSMYFYARFDKPFRTHRLADQQGEIRDRWVDGPNCRGAFGFGAVDEVNLVVGVSHVSVAKAQASVEREVQGRSFAEIETETRQLWQDRLDAFEVVGGTQGERDLFYTALYRLYCMPTDRGIDDENEQWISGVRHFSEFYALWDSVRNANSLIALVDPDLHRDFLNCFIDVAEHRGWLPDAWIAGHYSYAQAGSTADILFAEAALKGIDGVDYERALHFMQKNAEVATDNPSSYGRRGQELANQHGFLPNNVFYAVEFATQDWATSRLAAHLGQQEVAADYRQRADRIWSLWRDDCKSFALKHADGSWDDPFDPWRQGERGCYEGSPHEWSLCARHCHEGMCDRFGGPDAFAAHLEDLLAHPRFNWSEKILHLPYLFQYANRPGRGSVVARELLKEYYQAAPDGFQDNEDMGSNSAYIIAVSLGLYPVMGADWWQLSAPVFAQSRIRLGQSGATLEIRALDAHPDHTAIVGARFNGQPLSGAWITHADLLVGGILEIQCGTADAEWPTAAPPPLPW